MIETPSQRRLELLDRIVASLLEHGVGDLSLRPLAERAGTSARLLIYHFDSKENLVATALDEVRRRVEQDLGEAARHEHIRSPADLLRFFWDWALRAENRNAFRLLFEVDALSLFDRVSFSREGRRAAAARWVALLERAAVGLDEGGPLLTRHATLVIGAMTGLLQDVFSTGDEARTTAALESLIRLLQQDVVAAGSLAR